MHKCLLDGFSTEKKQHPHRCSEDQENLRYALMALVLHYTPHSGYNSANLGSQKTNSGYFYYCLPMQCPAILNIGLLFR